MDVAPLFELRLRTPRLELRLPSDDELRALGELAVAGIHPPEKLPFAVAWTDTVSVESFVEFHRAALDAWQPERWTLNFVTFSNGEPIGTQALSGEDFAVKRTVSSGSWLGREFQGQGFGTEQRAAVLELAFRGLGAQTAITGAVAHNKPSQRVSEKLGYRFVGEDTVSPRGEPVPHFNYRLERDGWRPPFQIELEGVEPCLALFGASG